jgi:hypothetical protein
MRLPAREIFFTAFVESGVWQPSSHDDFCHAHLADRSVCRWLEFFALHFQSGAQTSPDDEPLNDNNNDDRGQDFNRFHDASEAEVSRGDVGAPRKEHQEHRHHDDREHGAPDGTFPVLAEGRQAENDHPDQNFDGDKKQPVNLAQTASGFVAVAREHRGQKSRESYSGNEGYKSGKENGPEEPHAMIGAPVRKIHFSAHGRRTHHATERGPRAPIDMRFQMRRI